MSTVLYTAILALILAGCQQHQQQQESGELSDDELRAKARKLATETIIIDTHVDVPYRLMEKMEDISKRTEGGDFDYVRAREGGLDAPFMSIYVPASYEGKGARKYADRLIDMVEKFAKDWPDKFMMAYSAADVRAAFNAGRIALPMGMENGAPIEGKLENLRHFHKRGIRYITLTHSRNNHICDSSYDKERTWNGLSPFGREVVAEMNRLGIMIDVSHVSDSTFYQVMRLSTAPVIASHSSCRHFTPGWERNMDDAMIKLLATKGGVIQINFGSSFLRDSLRLQYDKAWDELSKYREEHKLTWTDPRMVEHIKKYREQHGLGYADVSDVVAHIDHVVTLVGTNHVGFGSDFDGVGDSLPTGLKDVSYFPNLIYELLRKGYTEDDVRKICSGNTLRVWEEVERVARTL